MANDSAEQAEHAETKTKRNWFKRHKVLTVIVALVILGIIGASTSGSKNNTTTSNSSTTTSTSSSKTAATTTASTPGLNQEADDGDFGFTVTSFQCGQSTLTQPDDTYVTSTAQGQFCVMNLNIKNIKSQPQSFDDSAQYVYDNTGKQYSDSSDATITANASGSQCSILPTVNPGNTLTCIVAFDVPKGVTPTYAMLHDSSASNGVKVSLQ